MPVPFCTQDAEYPAQTAKNEYQCKAGQLHFRWFNVLRKTEPQQKQNKQPALYRTAREALDLVADAGFCGGSVYHVEQLRTLLMLTAVRRYRSLILPQVKALAACDREKGSQYCETLYTYLTCGRSLKDTCAALFTHRGELYLEYRS